MNGVDNGNEILCSSQGGEKQIKIRQQKYTLNLNTQINFFAHVEKCEHKMG
jgi:hypothetical protein